MAVATEETIGSTTMEVKPARRAAKRAIDLAVGLPGAIVTAPVLVVLLVISAFAFRANPLFVQQRVGRGGRLIPVPKVRSLNPRVPSDADKYALNEFDVTVWGRFLRRLHLDELPQLWSVVLGHMSLIGPRPEIPRLAEGFSAEFAAARHTVRPGITGLWQISEDAKGLIAEAPEWDLLYAQHVGTRLDAWIAWRTVRQYLPGGRPLTLDDLPSWIEADGVDAVVATLGAD